MRELVVAEQRAGLGRGQVTDGEVALSPLDGGVEREAATLGVHQELLLVDALGREDFAVVPVDLSELLHQPFEHGDELLEHGLHTEGECLLRVGSQDLLHPLALDHHLEDGELGGHEGVDGDELVGEGFDHGRGGLAHLLPDGVGRLGDMLEEAGFCAQRVPDALTGDGSFVHDQTSVLL